MHMSVRVVGGGGRRERGEGGRGRGWVGGERGEGVLGLGKRTLTLSQSKTL